MKLAIIRLERPTRLTMKECDLGVDHLVPGSPEIVWVGVELKKDEYLDVAYKRVFEKYPMAQGWKVAFGTCEARMLK